MAEKKRHSYSQLLKYVLLIPTLFSFLGKVAMLIEYEAGIAKRNLGKVIALCIVLIPIILSTWLCLLALLFVFLITLPMRPLIALAIILALNLLLLGLIVRMIVKAKAHLFFPETRLLLSELTQLNK